MSKIIINTDGGSRGNPGPGAASFVVSKSNGEVIFEKGEYMDQTTNNKAEYRGVQIAMEWLSENHVEYNPSDVEFYCDSELVVKQLNGVYKVKNPDMAKYASQIQTLRKQLPFGVKFIHVRREENRDADLLVNQTLDAYT